MDDKALTDLFLPHLLERAEGVRNGKRLAHYTSAEAAYRIISSSQIWLRNAVLMNDFSEMRHGLTCLQAAWMSEAGVELKSWLEAKWPGLLTQLEENFNAHADSFTTGTFMLSLSQHEDDEDDLGRLSMWRAYGGAAGVALILNPTIFLSETDAIHAYSAPVVYRDVDGFRQWFAGWAKGLISAESTLLGVDREILQGFFFYAFRTFVLCTKHPGFREEKEWRVFHSPLTDGPSEWLAYETEVISGVPQQIVKIKLFDNEAAGVTGVSPKTLLNRLIIGPSEHPLPISHALNAALQRAGVEQPAEKIRASFIPLRQRREIA